MQPGKQCDFNPASLSFKDSGVEASFQADYYGKTISPLRWSVLLGAFLYGVLGIVDYMIIPELAYKAWFIRYCLVCPVIICVYSWTFTGYFRKQMQPILFIGGLVSSTGGIAIIILAPFPQSYLYFAGLLICFIFFYTLVGMRFITATTLCWSTFLVYEVAAIWKSDISLTYLIHNTLVILSFNAAGMIGSYFRERYMMSDFLHRQELGIALQDVDKARQDAEENSRIDPLTNLYNRRHFLSAAALELERANRYFNSLGVIMVDIDHFKLINDAHGHDVGDLVLLAVAENIRNTMRRYDIPCRYGGEEFVILLPETDLSAAVIIGMRLREIIESAVIDTCKGKITVTVSVGIAATAEDDQDKINVWINRADQALYEAKQAGRNQVKVWNHGRSTSAHKLHAGVQALS
jgi:diguanylate cyclase (GGDEF)-like protein